MVWKRKEKVYCEECKYYIGFGKCIKNPNMLSTPIRRKIDGGENCYNKNENNRCSDFEQPVKRNWKFWKR